MKRSKVLITRHGVIVDLVPTVDWHWHIDWRDIRIGASFQQAMWEFNLPFVAVWCDRYYRHGKTLNEIPRNAEVRVLPGKLY